MIFTSTEEHSLWENDYRSPKAQVRCSNKINGQQALVAIAEIAKGETVFVFSAPVSEERTRTSIQVGENAHIEAGDFASFTNHSCEPNSKIESAIDDERERASVMLTTIKAVKKGEELCFDYASTESELTAELCGTGCLCASDNCRETVKSFSDLNESEKEKLEQKDILCSYLKTVSGVFN